MPARVLAIRPDVSFGPRREFLHGRRNRPLAARVWLAKCRAGGARRGIPGFPGDGEEPMAAGRGAGDRPEEQIAFVFDLDGTLVDSVYHHVIAWHSAPERAGVALSVWRIHRRIGMSGGLFVHALARELGHRLTAAQLPAVQEDDQRPDPDLVLLAARRLGVPAEGCVVVGDSVWDLLAARRARALGVGLRSGGYGRDELEAAGAYRVYDDPADLLRHLDEVGLRPLDPAP